MCLWRASVESGSSQSGLATQPLASPRDNLGKPVTWLRQAPAARGRENSARGAAGQPAAGRLLLESLKYFGGGGAGLQPVQIWPVRIPLDSPRGSASRHSWWRFFIPVTSAKLREFLGLQNPKCPFWQFFGFFLADHKKRAQLKPLFPPRPSAGENIIFSWVCTRTPPPRWWGLPSGLFPVALHGY